MIQVARSHVIALFRGLAAGGMFITIVMLAAGCSRGADPARDAVRTRTAESIAADMLADVAYLASDELAGREVGEPAIAVAEEYIAQSFAEAGLEPLRGDSDYFLDFSLTRSGFDTSRMALEVRLPGATADGGLTDATPAAWVGLPARDFMPLGDSRPADIDGELVFAGYGITAPGFGYDDYSGLDVHGKVVLVMRGEPEAVDPSSPFFGEETTRHALFRTKAENAYRHGATGVVSVNPLRRSEHPGDFKVFAGFELDSDTYRAPPGVTARVGDDFPVLLASQNLLRWACTAWSIGADLENRVDAGATPAELGLPSLAVRIRVEQSAPERVAARDVAGMIDVRGTNRFVIIGAHHDHLGTIDPEAAGPDGDVVFNGADDNASGVSVVLELARRIDPASLDRDVIFVTFSGEERGLFGSIAFVTSGVVDLSNADLMINVDMAARNPDDPVSVYHSPGVPVEREQLQAIAEAAGLPVVLHSESMGRDDSGPFEMSRIPVIFPFSGFHEDYHGLDDEVDRLSSNRLLAMAEFVYGAVMTVAGAPAGVTP